MQVGPHSNSVEPVKAVAKSSRRNGQSNKSGKDSEVDDESSFTSEESDSTEDYDEEIGAEVAPKKRKATSYGTDSAQKKPKVSAKVKMSKINNSEEVVIRPKKNNLYRAPRPKGAPFADALNPDILQFMSDLALDNDREFMLSNQATSQERWFATRHDFTDFVGTIMKSLREVDPTITEVEPKEAIFRLNRDLRFTNDLRPYKTNLAAAWGRGGKKSPFALYYLSICPGSKSFLGGGLWHPPSSILHRIRTAIDEDASLLYEALSTNEFANAFGETGIAALGQEDKLKTCPKGYDKEHQEIELLRFRSFTVGKALTDEELVSPGFLGRVLEAYEALPQAKKSTGKKVAPAPYPVKSKDSSKKPQNPLFEKRSRNFSIGQDIQPTRDLTRFVKWPEYIRLQRQKRILQQRLKVPPAINQFSKVLDRNTATELFKLANKYRPESTRQKTRRLRAVAEAKAQGKEIQDEKPIVVKYGINHITALVEAKKAHLVVIADDVDPIELVIWLPALCRKMGVPYCIVKGKARLGTVVGKKTATAVAFTEVKPEDKQALATLVSAIKANYNDKYEEHRRTWGGGIMGAKSQAMMAKRAAAAAKEIAARQ
ncbi:hypothetical protein BZG36_04050 [Bifiguratus adelaidae]|uniref:Ribosomal protein eL8/eL30/eS12/Gadd45 domain-containing protein n=1 Tax=Bifiguratus adelaidae TaxID=1938954 RepID=A0A261XWF4_9FUNG|nr:hypothetical protein BZG36_04050 [Bifiguratus adelaidae]